VALLLAIEYSWNVFPSTNRSSYTLNFAHFILLVGLWSGYPNGFQKRKVAFNERVHEVEDDTIYSSSSTETDSTI
ncbi:9920_t:CDS:1, partial [Acaulospora colombiana]